jgi:hypothetical protein
LEGGLSGRRQAKDQLRRVIVNLPLNEGTQHSQEQNTVRRSKMKYFTALAITVFILGIGLSLAPTLAAAQDAKAKTCRMEQQCRWENFKKICVYVKVCR